LHSGGRTRGEFILETRDHRALARLMMDSEHPLRIVILAPSPGARSPIPKIARTLASALDEVGHSVILKNWGRTSVDERLARRVFDRVRDVLAVKRLFRDDAYDVLILMTAHDWVTLSRDLLLLAVCHSRPATVIQFHGSAPNRLQGPGDVVFRSVSRLLASKADGIMVLTSEDRRAWAAISGGVPVELVCNPYVRTAETGDRVARCQGGPRLFFAGRLVEQKGVAELLRGAAELRELDPEVVIAGDGPDRNSLKRLAEELGVRARFLGHLDASGMSQAYRSVDIFVLPTWAEGFPTVISEAMDFGLPIVTTRIRGIVDHLEEGVNAIMIEPKCHDQLAAAVSKIWADEGLRSAMASANRETVAKFEPHLVIGDYLRVIREVLIRR
jgi:glycosyltransferase involved in cell wall biosynthesis